jgi:predicted nucleic acid-binding protein
MNYALDANILSYYLKDRYDLKQKIKEKSKGDTCIIIPPITFYEVLCGLYASSATMKLKLFLSRCKKNACYIMEQEDWIQAAEIYSFCKKTGHPMSESDLLQAAFCINHNYTLVTNNIKHFAHLENLSIENWV